MGRHFGFYIDRKDDMYILFLFEDGELLEMKKSYNVADIFALASESIGEWTEKYSIDTRSDTFLVDIQMEIF